MRRWSNESGAPPSCRILYILHVLYLIHGVAFPFFTSLPSISLACFCTSPPVHTISTSGPVHIGTRFHLAGVGQGAQERDERGWEVSSHLQSRFHYWIAALLIEILRGK